MTSRYINTVSEPGLMRQALANWLTSEFLALRAARSGVLRLLSPWLSPVDTFPAGVAWDGVTDRTVSASVLEILLAYARNGGSIKLLVRSGSDPSTTRTMNILRQWQGSRLGAIEIRSSPKEHAKIWVGQRLSFFGSSNLTEGGLGLNRELMEVSSDAAKIAELQRQADTFFNDRECVPLRRVR